MSASRCMRAVRCCCWLTSRVAAQVAPGIDLERDVLAHMPFRPLIEDVQLMDARCFLP